MGKRSQLLEVTPKEARLLDFLRALRFGKVVVEVQEGEPAFVLEPQKSVKL